MQAELLRDLVDQAKDRDAKLLAAGLTVLAKDVAEYLAATARPEEGAQLFQELYLAGLNEERQYWEAYGPNLFSTLEKAGLPFGFAQAATEGKADVFLLGDRSIMHEWTTFPGRDLLKEFATKFKETICGKDGPYEKLMNGLIGQADLPITIAGAILAVGFSAATFWYPLAVYVGLLLAKAALKTYCETGEVVFE
jgi:hypothetical protein